MLGADVVVTQLECLAQRQLENLLGPRGKRNMPTWRLRTLTDYLDDLGPHGLEADPEALETTCGYALALVDETEKDVLGPYVIVIEQPGLFLGKHDNSPGPVGEPFKHSSPLKSTPGLPCASRSIAKAGDTPPTPRPTLLGTSAAF